MSECFVPDPQLISIAPEPQSRSCASKMHTPSIPCLFLHQSQHLAAQCTLLLRDNQAL